MTLDWRATFLKEIPGTHLPDEPMSGHTTFRIGGPADLLAMPADGLALKAAVDFLESENVPWMVIGGGSNLLVSDEGIRGAVIKTPGHYEKSEKDVEINGFLGQDEIYAPAGMSLAKFVTKTVSSGKSGLQNLAGIPGTVGGAIFMNAGAFGTSISDCLLAVEIASSGNDIYFAKKDELGFGYRTSAFQKDRSKVILGAKFRFSQSEPEILKKRLEEILSERRKKQPLWQPCAGSFFRNPPGLEPAGVLIDKAGLKGLSVGGARVSEHHANFIVNTGGATCSQVLELVEIINEKMFANYGIRLAPEVRIVK